jgi:hypothetical protein
MPFDPISYSLAKAALLKAAATKARYEEIDWPTIRGDLRQYTTPGLEWRGYSFPFFLDVPTTTMYGGPVLVFRRGGGTWLLSWQRVPEAQIVCYGCTLERVS